MVTRREFRKKSFPDAAAREGEARAAEPQFQERPAAAVPPVQEASSQAAVEQASPSKAPSNEASSAKAPSAQTTLHEPSAKRSGAVGAPSSAEGVYEDLPPISREDREVDLRGLDVPVEAFLDDDSEYGKIPQPEVFNAYPPELQRKIMEWTDRDVRARRDDESRRRDEAMRAEIDEKRRRQMFPAVITVLALLCAAVTGIVTGNPLFPLVFLLVPLAVIAARVAGDDGPGSRRNKPPKV